MKKGVDGKTPHRWHRPRHATWLEYCWRCGLVAGKNDVTLKAIRAGCFKEETVVEDIVRPTP